MWSRTWLRLMAVAMAVPALLAVLHMLLLLNAAWLSRRFIGWIETAAGGLLQAVERDPGAHALLTAANAVSMQELQSLGHALTSGWYLRPNVAVLTR